MEPHASPQDGFWQTFLSPLVEGRDVTVGIPLDRVEFAGLLDEVEVRSPVVEELERGLQRRAEMLFPSAPQIRLDESAVRIVVALHQILFAFHAASAHHRVWATRLEALARDTVRLLAPLDRQPHTRSRVVLHHLLVERVFELYRSDTQLVFKTGSRFYFEQYRSDTRLAFKAGSRFFFGEDVKWTRIPFVRWRVLSEETRGVHPVAEIPSTAFGDAFRIVLQHSPLTRLLRAVDLFGELSLTRLDGVVDDPLLCRAAVNGVLDAGWVQALPAFALGFADMLYESDVTLASRQKVARLLVTLAMTAAQWADDTPSLSDTLLDVSYEPPLTSLRFASPALPSKDGEKNPETDALRRDRALRQGWAIIDALVKRPDILMLPPLDAEGEALANLERQLHTLKAAIASYTTRITREIDDAFPI